MLVALLVSISGLQRSLVPTIKPAVAAVGRGDVSAFTSPLLGFTRLCMQLAPTSIGYTQIMVRAAQRIVLTSDETF